MQPTSCNCSKLGYLLNQLMQPLDSFTWPTPRGFSFSLWATYICFFGLVTSRHTT